MLANPAIPQSAPSWLRAKHVFFALVGAMTAYVLVHNERFLVEPEHELWEYYRPIQSWLLPHAIAGTCAMLAAPLQFSDRLRRRHPKFHRVTGRVYVAGVFVLAPIGAYTQYLDQLRGVAGVSFTLLAVINMVMLLVPTAIALRVAMQRKITLHRQWMIRSYAIALVFFVNRFILGVTGLEKNPAMVEAVIWSCLAMSVLMGDLVIQWQERRAVR